MNLRDGFKHLYRRGPRKRHPASPRGAHCLPHPLPRFLFLTVHLS